MSRAGKQRVAPQPRSARTGKAGDAAADTTGPGPAPAPAVDAQGPAPVATTGGDRATGDRGFDPGAGSGQADRGASTDRHSDDADTAIDHPAAPHQHLLPPDGAGKDEATTIGQGAPGTTTTLLVDDLAADVGPGQMRKSEFLRHLRRSVERATDAALAGTSRSSEGCPWIDFWFGYYETREPERVERAIRRFAPDSHLAEDAEAYIPAVSDRVRRSVEEWARGGRGSPVPAEVRQDPEVREAASAGLPREGAGPAVRFKARTGGPAGVADPEALEDRLGPGRALDDGVRHRMELAYGTDFSTVRVHADGVAAELSSRLNARAFAIGEPMAFGAGEYRPGTVEGDILIAHELAHVAQQSGPGGSGDRSTAEMEEDADRAARIAVASSSTGVRGALARLGATAMPRLRSGIGLRRCGGGGTTPSFPSYSEIVGDGDVQTETDAAWASTLAAATTTSRREEGFWIKLDAGSRKYQFDPKFVGTAVGPDDGAAADPGSKPADAPAADGGVYTVGLFHTHTPTEHRTVGRPVGPSGADDSFHNSNDVVGVVYDFIEDPAGSGSIPAGHPKSSPAQRYHSGPDRRSS